MKHSTTPSFWEYYYKLPSQIQELADKNFALLKQDSNHPSLHLKKIRAFWSVRIGRQYRALAVLNDKDLIWFWIGSHSDYDRLIK